MSFLYPYSCYCYCECDGFCQWGGEPDAFGACYQRPFANNPYYAIGESGSSHFAIYGGNVLSTGVKELISVHKSKSVDKTFVRVANSKLFSVAPRTKNYRVTIV